MAFLEKFARKLGQTENVLAYAENGVLEATDFTGSPRTATVTLSQAQPSASYSVTVSGTDARLWSVESRTTTSFVISANASTALTGPVFWSVGGNV